MEPQIPNDQKCRDIVTAYRRERMPADTRAAAWARLQAAIEEGDESPAPGVDRRRDWIWGAVLAAAAVLILIAGVRGRTSRPAGERDAGSQAAHEATATEAQSAAIHAHGAGAEAERVTLPPEESPSAAATAEPATEQRPRPRVQDVPKDMPALDAELALLRAAREALARKAPAAALPSLEQHAREFPDGHLAEERMLLRAQALCELGRREAAREAAAELVRAFPSSPHAATAAGLCAD